MDAVAIEEVTKTYGDHKAVDGVSLHVPRGSVYGFIGPNGSGKSTTLRMIMRILFPDRGRILVLGEDSVGAANDRIGYLPEERNIYKKMKVRDVLRFHAEIKGMRRPRPVVDEWLERMGLADWGDKKVDALSKGMAQKVQFIATVIAKPDLIILDEPFSGLDPVNFEVIRDVVLELNRSGATIIFSTHDMSAAERMCDFIFMIAGGKKVLDGPLQSIRDQFGTDVLRVRLQQHSAKDFSSLPGVTRAVDLGNFQELRMEPGADAQRVLAALTTIGRVEHFEIAKPSLHDIFVRLAGGAEHKVYA